MSETWTIDFYELLKKGGVLAEQKVNQFIKGHLNQERVIESIEQTNQELAKQVTNTRQYTEILSTLLNFPTKNDLANNTNLILQSEEKIDQLENLLYQVNSLAEEINQKLDNNHGNIDEIKTMLHKKNQKKKPKTE